jgi:type VI secretion system protein ImpJ
MINKARPAYWYQGLFLQPQHFQYQELFFSSSVHHIRRTITPYFWGVGALRFRMDALLEKVVELTEATVIFEDGTVVDIPETGSVQPRSLREIENSITPGKPLRIYLALHRFMHNQKNVETLTPSGSLQNIRTRFIANEDPEPVPNLHEGDDEAQIFFLKYLVRIVCSHELDDFQDYHCIPVAEIESIGESLQFSRTFIPPTPEIASSPALQDIIRDIEDALLSRAKLLELYKISRPYKAEDLEGNFLRYLNTLCAINQFIPALQHIIETPSIHPWTVYGMLRQLIGTLSTFTDRTNALGKLNNGTELIHSYQHDKLEICFSEAKRLIIELLNTIIIGDKNIIELKRNGYMFSNQIPAESFDKRNQVYLIIRGTGDREELLDSLLHHAKVGSPEGMQTLVARAFDGVPIKYMPNSPSGIPEHPDGFIFMLERTGTIWNEIQLSSSICLYWDEATDDAKAEIIISKK